MEQAFLPRLSAPRLAPHAPRPWALVPTKELARAKSRLGQLLSAEQRRRLVLAMLEDVLGVLLAAPDLAGVAVIGSDPTVAALATRLGALPLHDGGAELNEALALGQTQLARRGAGSLLVIPGDVPLINGEDVAELARLLREQVSVALAPAHDGLGTNGLALRLPSPLQFQFGVDSFRRHAAQARELSLPTSVYLSSSLGLDIDTPADLDALDAVVGAPRTRATLQDMCTLDT